MKLAKFELCVLLGKTPSELDALLTPRELVEWMVYMRIAPRGERRLDYGFGAVMFCMRKLMGDKSVQMKDCVANYDPKPVRSVEEMNAANAVALAQMTAFGAARKVK